GPPPHPHLHPFPPRRSSDLTSTPPASSSSAARLATVDSPAARLLWIPTAAWLVTAAVPSPEKIPPRLTAPLPMQPATLPKTLWRDRKSTRLNSSHVKISYAV